MREYSKNGQVYRLANGLTPFQLDMQVHLTNWKWEHLTRECGYFGQIPYDSMLPASMESELQPLYRPIVSRVLEHQRRLPFKLHKFVGHMASSQVACINLFVPLLAEPEIAAEVLRLVRPDLQSIATDHLDAGFQIEYWPGKGDETGPLNDHTKAAGTDADIAIAYRDMEGRLRLWLIEHKLTEKAFTTCGGAVGAGRSSKHRCSPAADVLGNHDLCYYHEHCGYAYWPVTDRHHDVFPPERLAAGEACPFKDGVNQLWRNTLLALAVEDSEGSPYAGVQFSVVHHPGNTTLEPSMAAFRQLLGVAGRFSSFTSDRIVNAAATVPALREWATWYKELYRV